jgi:transposase-like protein
MTHNYTLPNDFDMDYSEPYQESIPPLEPQYVSNEQEINPTTKKIRKKRNAYQKIDDNLRVKLLEAVQQNGETLKAAANRFGINYSSAKSILHTYRKEGRILKKSSQDKSMKRIPGMMAMQNYNPVAHGYTPYTYSYNDIQM